MLPELHRHPHILGNVIEDLLVAAFSPEFGGFEAGHAGRLARQAHPLRGLVESHRIAQ